MNADVLARLFEHNIWANDQIIQACASLSAGQLDAESESATKGSIRTTLHHLVSSQQGYLALLNGDPRPRTPSEQAGFEELAAAAARSGDGLLMVARDADKRFWSSPIETDDGYLVEPWVVMLQVINHATEHREQIKSMLTGLGVVPPAVDGWSYGEETGALQAISE